MQHSTQHIVYIDADLYYDAASTHNKLRQAESGEWDVELGIVINANRCNIDILAFYVVDIKKFFIANLKYGLQGNITPCVGESSLHDGDC